MAIQMVFSVIDAKTGVYASPFYMLTKGAAIRAFIDTCDDEKHPFHLHPEDYTLVFLGNFDDWTGRIEQPSAPEVLITASQALVK